MYSDAHVGEVVVQPAVPVVFEAALALAVGGRHVRLVAVFVLRRSVRVHAPHVGTFAELTRHWLTATRDRYECVRTGIVSARAP